MTGRVIACALAVLLWACAPPPPPEPPPPPPLPILHVGVTADSPPYVFRREEGYAGIEIDFAERLAEALGRKLVIVEVTWDEQIPSLLGGGTDVIMSGMAITPARAARVAFGEPYLTTSLQGVIRSADAKRYPTPDALLRLSPRIGVKAGTTGEALVRQRRPDEQIVLYRSSHDAITELLNYRVDVYVGDAPVIEAAVARYAPQLVAYPRVGKQALAWAFRPEDADLRYAANDVLAQWRTDGTLTYVLSAWPGLLE